MLYHLERVQEAVANGHTIYLPEGEKDVHAIEAEGGYATTAPGGAANWDKVDPTPLYGAKIDVIVDKDKGGQKRAQDIMTSLVGKASIDFKQAKEGKDAADHIAAGYGLNDFEPAPAPETSSQRHLKITRASDITMKATRWLWEDHMGCWIPLGALILLGGREGVGKSTVCADLVARITIGELPGDYEGTPKSVVIVSTEDDWEATIKPRLAAADANLNRVYRVNAVSPEGLEGTLSLPEDTKHLEELIREHDVALVILDPLLSVINGKLDTHKDAEIRRGLEPVVAIAHNTRCSLIGLIHVNKSTEGDLMNHLMGSRALSALPRGVLFSANYTPTERPTEGPVFEEVGKKRSEFVFGQLKNNLAAKIMQSHQYHMETEIVGYDEEAQKDIKASRIVFDKVIDAGRIRKTDLP